MQAPQHIEGLNGQEETLALEALRLEIPAFMRDEGDRAIQEWDEMTERAESHVVVAWGE